MKTKATIHLAIQGWEDQPALSRDPQTLIFETLMALQPQNFHVKKTWLLADGTPHMMEFEAELNTAPTRS